MAMLYYVALCLTLLTGSSRAKYLDLIFEDNFEKFDYNNWHHEVTAWGGGNGEFQIYTDDPKNTYVKDNTLFIKPTLVPENINPLTKKPFGESFMSTGTLDLIAMYEQCTQQDNYGCKKEGKYGFIQPIMSGRIRTKKRFSFRFGRLEVFAKMAAGDWMWPAIWMLPETNVYGGWPRSGEIDLVEIIGNEDLKCKGKTAGRGHMGSTLHWGPHWTDNRWDLTHGGKLNESSNYADHFHKYVVDWSENGLRFYIDDYNFLNIPEPPIDQNANWTSFWDYAQQNGGFKTTKDNLWANGTTKMTPFDEAFHIIMNVAVGGTGGFFQDGCENKGYPKPWKNSDGAGAAKKFWEAKDQWYPTWKGEDAAMQVKYVRVYQLKDGVPPTPKPTPKSGSPKTSTLGVSAFILACLVCLLQ